jgi:cobalt/nickel transport protein
MDGKTKALILAGLLFALVLGIFISPFASPHPDGLEWVAEQKGFLELSEGEPSWKASLIPDYALPGVSSEAVATAVAGLAGTILVFAVGWGIGALISSKKNNTEEGDG